MTEIVQKIKTIRWQHLLILLLMVAVAAGMDSCSTSGKLTKKERKAQIEAAKKQLEEIINGTTTKTLEQQERTVNDIARKNLNDKDLNAMIDEARQVLKEKFADQEKIRQQKVDAARAQLLD
ncbi:MAG: hypothetical protein Q8867_10225, partial [Bacteroidota bacterium]|nr:hypothetical protein [Bacteroidota bacterium]